MPAPPPSPSRCARCHLRGDRCLCAEVPRIHNRTNVVIVRHTLERKRASNSGRIADLALAQSQLCTFGADDEALPEALLTRPGTWLLFPEGAPRASAPDPAPAHLVVLDATWSQARRMRQRITALRGLPILALPPPPPRPRLRTAPRPESMATLESIAYALGLLEGPTARDALLDLYDLMVERAAFPLRNNPP